MTTPEDITSSLQDALFDCDWLPMEVFTGETCRIEGKEIKLHRERYQVLIVPPVEVIPYATLARVKQFFDAGGIVVGCGPLPTKSASIGKTAADIAALRTAVWGESPTASTKTCRTSPAGGRAYLLAETPTPTEIAETLIGDAGLHPTLEVLAGETNNWLHVLHRVKCDRDVFLVCNQDHQSPVRHFRFRLTAAGFPEVWDAMRNEITTVPFERKGESVELELTLEPNESVLLVFQEQARPLPARPLPVQLPSANESSRRTIEVVRQPTPDELKVPSEPPRDAVANDAEAASIKQGAWIWHDEPEVGAAVRYFRAVLDIPADRTTRKARGILTCDNFAVLYVNGKAACKTDDELNSGWRNPVRVDLKPLLRSGQNVLAVRAENFDAQNANPAGLLGVFQVEFEQGQPIVLATGPAWRSCANEEPGWAEPELDDGDWKAVKVLGKYGIGPWGDFQGTRGRRLTVSPIASDPFWGSVEMPAGVDLQTHRVYLEMDDLPDTAAAVRVNGDFAGGCIGAPLRVNVTAQIKSGSNTIEIQPRAPKSARLRVVPFK